MQHKTAGIATRHAIRRCRQGALLLSALAAFAAALVAPAGAQAPALSHAQPTATLTFDEEFNGRALDLTRWSFRGTGPRNDGTVTPDAVSVGNGMLTIKTYTELGRHYTGMIATPMLGPAGFEQKHGYFEAKMKFKTSPGMWSAFWLQSPTIGDPVGNPQLAGVEMDIAEHRARCMTAAPDPSVCDGPDADNRGGDADITNRIQQALVWDGYGLDKKSFVRLSEPLDNLDDGGWHTWGLRWTPTDLTWYYDGTPVWYQTCPNTLDPACPISQRSEYIVLSSEIWQEFAGDIPAGGYGSRLTSKTKMQVDYVRVYTG